MVGRFGGFGGGVFGGGFGGGVGTVGRFGGFRGGGLSCIVSRPISTTLRIPIFVNNIPDGVSLVLTENSDGKSVKRRPMVSLSHEHRKTNCVLITDQETIRG